MENCGTAACLLVGLLLGLSVLPAHAGSGVAGMMDGKFTPCPPSPNCVSSQSTDPGQRIEPLHYSGDMASAKEALLQVVTALRGARLEEDAGSYIHFTFRSRIFRFVDDVEFYFLANESLIHLKSASRTGYSDLGVNRRRCDLIKSKFVSLHGEEAGGHRSRDR